MLTSAGTPYIYYGEEIGMQGVKPDEDIRLPMQWSADDFAGFSTVQPWRNPYTNANNPQFDYTQVNVELQTGDSTSLLEHYRTLIGLRKSNPTLQTGDTILLETDNSGIYAILRKDANGTFLILANLSDEAITDYAIEFEGTELAESIVSVESVYGENQAAPMERSGEAFIYKPFENLNPYAMYILKLNQ
jgi:glycosidase